MTFKHVKFEDSVVMRSLEKLAKEKGLVKPEKITKTAAVKTDLTATANLMQNILNLCAGLRQSGFTKHANELEEKFMVYKQAQTLYETTKETGEDLVESAHSKGSHKLEDVDSDEAVFETIVDQHMKHLKMIEKAPTGKLSNARNARNVINAVKLVFADQALSNLIAKAMMEVKRIAAKVTILTESDLTVSWSHFEREINRLVKPPIKLDNLQDLKGLINDQRYRLKPGAGVFGVSRDTWATVGPLMLKMLSLTEDAIANRNKELELKNEPEAVSEDASAPAVQDDSSKKLINQIDSNLAQLGQWAVFVSKPDENTPEDLKTAQDWILKKITYLTNLKAAFLKETDQASKVAMYSDAFAKNTQDFAQFKKDWIA